MEETLESTASGNNPQPGVMAVGLKFGVIMGIVGILFMVVLIVMGSNPLKSDWKGWVNAAISIAIIVLAHKSFKDSGDGYMTYGQGFGVSFVAFFTSVVIGALFTFIFIKFIDPGLFEQFLQMNEEEMRAKNMPEDSIETAIKFTRSLFWVFYLIGGVVIGAIISAIIPIFTRKNNPSAFPG